MSRPFRGLLKQNSARLLVLGSSLVVSVLAYVSPVTYASSDPHFSLIVSQSILDHGTIKLDAYHETAGHLFDTFFWQVVKLNGHTYYNYPTGPALLSLPFVILARSLGKDMLIVEHNHQFQNLMSAVEIGLVLLIAYLIGRSYLAPLTSFVISAVFVLGTSVISTMGTALWNMNFAVLAILLSLLLISRFDGGKSPTVHPYLLGVFLFFAFLSRPSVAFFIVVVFIYLLRKDKQALIRTAAAALALLFLFVAHSQLEYGRWLPLYYTASNWFERLDVGRPLVGILLSPSRGLFVFSPFLALTVIGSIGYIRRMEVRLLFWLCLPWTALQLIAVSTTRQWWGGFSYGPRLLTDIIPAFLLMTFILWQELAPRLEIWARRIVIGSFFFLGALGIFIHSFQGLFNIWTADWNAFPNIDHYPEYLFDWRYPQFLVTRESFHERRLGHHLRELDRDASRLSPYVFGDTLRPSDDANNAIFVGWWLHGPEIRWTEITRPQILFIPSIQKPTGTYVLEISSDSYGEQDAHIYLNDSEIGTVTFPGHETTVVLEFDADLLRPARVNQLLIELPDATYPRFGDLQRWGLRFAPHRLGLADVSVIIRSST